MSQSATGPVGARTARPCESCLRKRARWYCPADDAFLCQACDSYVHSANQLASRHERVRLKTSSSSALKIRIPDVVDPLVPSWHRRKARTPRHHKKNGSDCEAHGRAWSLVPDLEAMAADEGVEEEEQLIYRVPILVLDPVLSDFRSPPGISEDGGVGVEGVKLSAVAAMASVDGISGFVPSEIDMAEFAMDVERLLGQGPHQDSFSIDDLGLSGPREEDGGCDLRCAPVMTSVEISGSIRRCKKEEVDPDDDTFHIDISCGEEVKDRNPSRLMLKLDYESVISGWSTTQELSPWADDRRPPNLNPEDDSWQDYMETILGGQAMATGLKQHMPGASIPVDIGREARVLRYREKRRTRLFSKKIRYEVRKLNAEKRPRIKGRFVKTPSFAPATTTAVALPKFVVLNL